MEISSKSKDEVGIELSAFNLLIDEDTHMTVECAYQGSKVFEKGGPYTDLYQVSSKKAKKDARLRTSGYLKGFNFRG